MMATYKCTEKPPHLRRLSGGDQWCLTAIPQLATLRTKLRIGDGKVAHEVMDPGRLRLCDRWIPQERRP